jgi:spore cortex formation protein SpoVR/YcgB (stage V sporulation)
MKRLHKYATEIKQCLENMSVEDVQNIILICRDAKLHIFDNANKPYYFQLDKSFRDMEALAENVVSEGQQQEVDPLHTRIEKMKAITCAWDNYFTKIGLEPKIVVEVAQAEPSAQ